MNGKTFNHNGGIWTRPDIPNLTPQPWMCHVCKKDVDAQIEEYQILVGTQLVDKVRYIPASRYWHGYIVGIEFCSPECSLSYYQENKNAASVGY